MKALTSILILIFSTPAVAGITAAEIPDGSHWYFHVDLEQMRDTPFGSQLYAWLEREALQELQAETGVDARRELNRITAFGASEAEATVIVQGELSQASRDKLLAALAAKGSMETLRSGKYNYYRIDEIRHESGNTTMNSDGFFMSFDKPDAIVFSKRLEDLLQVVSGELREPRNVGSPLLILTARRPLVQAGVETSAFEERWDSGVLRQARQVAFQLADDRGNADLQLFVTAKDAATTDSLAAIVRGLIGLQALSGDADPEVSDVLQRLQVTTEDGGLKLKLNIEADKFLGVLD